MDDAGDQDTSSGRSLGRGREKASLESPVTCQPQPGKGECSKQSVQDSARTRALVESEAESRNEVWWSDRKFGANDLCLGDRCCLELLCLQGS